MDDAINYSELRENLKSVLDRVCDDSIALMVKRRNGKDVIILSKDDYDKMDETAYLNASPANARHLREAIKRFKTKKGFVKYNSIQELKDEIVV
jgi:antitoxin YefM